jgi:hypothetical protein
VSGDPEKTAIDALSAHFYEAFSNGDGAPDVDRLYDIFLPQARIVKNTGGAPVVYDLKGFAEPRRAILSDGTLRRFREYETAEETAIFQNIAHRFSRYRKTWEDAEGVKHGAGAKSMQFVRTVDGWKIAALVWDDVEA